MSRESWKADYGETRPVSLEGGRQKRAKAICYRAGCLPYPISQQEQSGGNYTAPRAESVEPVTPFTPSAAAAPGPQPTDQPKVNIHNSDNVVDGWFRTLGIDEAAEDKLPEPSEVARALTAWRMGANSVTKLEKALNISHRQAYKLVQKLKEDGLITE